jgi:hypothetical protein
MLQFDQVTTLQLRNNQIYLSNIIRLTAAVDLPPINNVSPLVDMLPKRDQI